MWICTIKQQSKMKPYMHVEKNDLMKGAWGLERRTTAFAVGRLKCGKFALNSFVRTHLYFALPTPSIECSACLCCPGRTRFRHRGVCLCSGMVQTATAVLYFNPPIRLPPDPSIHHSLTQTTTPQLSSTSIMHRSFSVLALLLVSTVCQAQSESETSTLLRRAQQVMQQAAPTATDPKKGPAPAAAPKTPAAEPAPKATHAVPAVPAVPGATATAAAAASAPVIPNCQASFTYAAAPTKLPINFERIKSDEWFRYQIASLRYV